MSENPKDVLRSQVEYWEGIAREAREQLRIAEAVLPGLRESLERIQRAEQQQQGGAQAPLSSPAPPPPPTAPPTVAREEPQTAEETEPETPPPGLAELRNSDEIGRVIRSCLPDIPDRFLQKDVAAALAHRGFFVNRSTLRGNLQRLADMGEAIRVAEPGRGRRATVFLKL